MEPRRDDFQDTYPTDFQSSYHAELDAAQAAAVPPPAPPRQGPSLWDFLRELIGYRFR